MTWMLVQTFARGSLFSLKASLMTQNYLYPSNKIKIAGGALLSGFTDVFGHGTGIQNLAAGNSIQSSIVLDNRNGGGSPGDQVGIINVSIPMASALTAQGSIVFTIYPEIADNDTLNSGSPVYGDGHWASSAAGVPSGGLSGGSLIATSGDSVIYGTTGYFAVPLQKFLFVCSNQTNQAFNLSAASIWAAFYDTGSQ